MVIISLLDEDECEGSGYEVRTDSKRGRGIFSTKEFNSGDVIFTEIPSICVPRDREHSCFHCALPIESINEAASRLSKNIYINCKAPKKQKYRIIEIIPMDKKPPVVIDESTELKFCTVSCYQKAQKDYLQVLRSKWSEFKAIENWILLNKGPAHDQATLIALMKILCMRAQDCDKFYDIDTMVNRGVQLDNLDKFTKIVHSKLKAQNVFLETNHKELLRWAGQIAANFQLGTVSAIKPWIQRVKEIRVLSKLQHAEVLKEFKDFDGCAKRIYEKYIERKKIQKNQSSCEPNIQIKHMDNSSKLSIIALRKIRMDEELCFDYTLGRSNVSKMTDRDERQATLNKELGFDCTCSLCRETGYDWADVD